LTIIWGYFKLCVLFSVAPSGAGVALMPTIAIRPGEIGIKYIGFDKAAPKRTIGLVWRKSSVREVLLKRLGGLFEEGKVNFFS
jgi:DNA-binding transcriptional LysR family regulator